MTDGGTAALQRQVDALTARVRELEDRQAITQLIASYGPAVDSMSAGVIAEQFAADGVYDAGGSDPYIGREAVAGLIHGDMHQGFVHAGCAHVLSLPVIDLDGDRATAVNHSRVYLHEGQGWRLARVSANRWRLRRRDRRWEVELRTNRLLDGDPAARALLVREQGSAGA